MKIEDKGSQVWISGESKAENDFIINLGRLSFTPRCAGMLSSDNMCLVLYKSELGDFFREYCLFQKEQEKSLETFNKLFLQVF